jgi:hypothetical protein
MENNKENDIFKYLNSLKSDKKDSVIKKIACVEELMKTTESLLKIKEKDTTAFALWINTGIIMMMQESSVDDMRTVIETICKERFTDTQSLAFKGMISKLNSFKEGKIDGLSAFGGKDSYTDFSIDMKDGDENINKKNLSGENLQAYEFINKRMKDIMSDKDISKEEVSVRVEMLSKEVIDKFGIDVHIEKVNMIANAGDDEITKKISELIDYIAGKYPDAKEGVDDSSLKKTEAITLSILSLLHMCRVMGGVEFMMADLSKSKSLYKWIQKAASGINSKIERDQLEKEMMEDPELDAKLKEELKSILNNKPNQN